MPTGAELFDAYVRLRPKADPQFGSQVQREIGDPIDRLESKIKGLAVAGAAAVFFKGGVDELAEQQKVAAQTEATLRSTAGAAKVTADEIGDLADELQNLSGKDAEAIRAGENLLLTFTRVRNEAGAGNDIYNRATKAALDLSVALGTDLSSAALQVGKALNDPVAGYTALQRAGVQLTQQQKDQVKAFVESGNILEAQKIILSELETQVGGSAAAYGDTLGGKVERARNALDDFKANVIGAAAPALEQLAGFAVSAGDAFAQLPQPLQTTGVLLAGLAVASRPVGAAVDAVKGAVTGLSNAAQGFRSEGLSGFLSTTAGKATATAAAVAGVAIAADELKKTAEAGTRTAEQFGKSWEDNIARAARSGDIDDLKKQQRDLIQAAVDLQRQNIGAGFLGLFGGQKLQEEAQRNADAVTALVSRAKELATAYGVTEAAGLQLALSEQKQTDSKVAAAAADQQAAEAAKKFGDQLDEQERKTQDARRAVEDLYDATIKVAGGRIDLREAQRGVIDARSELERLQRAPLEQGETYEQRQEKIRRASDDLERALLRQAQATVDLADAQAKANGQTLTGKEKADLYKGALQELADTVSGPLRSEIQGLISDLDKVPSEKNVKINVDSGSAVSEIQTVLDKIDAFRALASVYGLGPEVEAQLTTDPAEAARAQAEADARKAAGRASGGPVTAGRPYRVGEGGKAELYRPRSGEQYLIPGDDGTIIPGAGAGTVIVNMAVRDTADEAIKAWQMFEMRQLAGVV